jgi:hypothetical protein
MEIGSMSKSVSQPRYRYSLRLLEPLARILLGIPSPISRDAALMLQGAHSAPRTLHTENIPIDSSFFLVFNHYDRPGLSAWWGLAAIPVTIAAHRPREPRQVHFMMAREWHYPSGFNRWVTQPLTRWFFGQFARTYGCIGLPPALELDEYRGLGAVAIRRALALTRKTPPELLGVSPEGNTGCDLGLCKPLRGAGLMLLFLTHNTIPFLPVGIFEDENKTINVNFGAPFKLDLPGGLSKEERDNQAARQVMVQIGKLLPERMWGDYREEIKRQGVEALEYG